MLTKENITINHDTFEYGFSKEDFIDVFTNIDYSEYTNGFELTNLILLESSDADNIRLSVQFKDEEPTELCVKRSWLDCDNKASGMLTAVENFYNEYVIVKDLYTRYSYVKSNLNVDNNNFSILELSDRNINNISMKRIAKIIAYDLPIDIRNDFIGLYTHGFQNEIYKNDVLLYNIYKESLIDIVYLKEFDSRDFEIVKNLQTFTPKLNGYNITNIIINDDLVKENNKLVPYIKFTIYGNTYLYNSTIEKVYEKNKFYDELYPHAGYSLLYNDINDSITESINYCNKDYSFLSTLQKYVFNEINISNKNAKEALLSVLKNPIDLSKYSTIKATARFDVDSIVLGANYNNEIQHSHTCKCHDHIGERK